MARLAATAAVACTDFVGHFLAVFCGVSSDLCASVVVCAGALKPHVRSLALDALLLEKG